MHGLKPRIAEEQDEPTLAELREEIVQLRKLVEAHFAPEADPSAAMEQHLIVCSSGTDNRALHDYRKRRLRSSSFDDFPFDREGCWDIMLDLHSREFEKRGPVSVSSACIASALPSTTALRHLQHLEQAGLVEIVPCRTDARSKLVHLTERAHQCFEAYFERASRA